MFNSLINNNKNNNNNILLLLSLNYFKFRTHRNSGSFFLKNFRISKFVKP
jgi:hypothetical protein